MIGQELQGRFRVTRLLGEGGMGAVYEGENIKIGRKVAIKVLHPQFAKNPQVVQRFHQEARAAAAIGHPNIIEVLDMGELEDGSSYMVLEYLKGQDWSDEIEEMGPQPLSRVASILVQVCDALQAAHSQGIVHRDLKPENIYLIDRHGRDDFVKVLDFGISKVLPTDSEHRALTQTNMMLGTAYYMSPEQTKAAKHIDHRSDIYTLGVILFQALTGYYPFDDAALPMLFVKICTEDPPPLSDYRKDLPPQVESVFRKLIAKKPKARYQSCAQVKAALEQFLDHDDAPDVIADAPDPKARPATGVQLDDDIVVAPQESIALPTQSGGARGLLIGALLLAIGGGGAALAFNAGENTPEEPVDAPPDDMEQAAPTEQDNTNQGEEMIQIVAYTTGVDAEDVSIFVDGVEHPGDSLRLDVPADGSVHEFEARAEGYSSGIRRVAYVAADSVELQLETVRAASMRGTSMRAGTTRMTTQMTTSQMQDASQMAPSEMTTEAVPSPMTSEPMTEMSMEATPMGTIQGGATMGFGT